MLEAPSHLHAMKCNAALADNSRLCPANAAVLSRNLLKVGGNRDFPKSELTD